MDRIESLPLSALRESPFNPRKTYPAGELQALADSIASQGVMQPIVVRPLPESQSDIEHQFELVFGHRRFRAAALAGLDAIPAIVRVMDNRECAIAQTHENAKRADVTPFEEADSFVHLMREHRMSADQVAEAVDMSRSYVYGRIKLAAAAAPAVRQACTEQGLSAEIALYLARIPNAKLQAKALAGLKAYDGEWVSVREAKRVLERGYTIRLHETKLDLADATLLPGAGACTTCPKLACNDPDLADQPADLCTDKPCYEHKARLQLEREAERLRQQGHKVLQGEELAAACPNTWNRPEDHLLVAHAHFELDGQRVAFEDALKRLPPEQQPKLTYALDERGSTPELRCYVPDAALQAMREALGCADAEDDESGSSSDFDQRKAQAMADWTPAEQALTDRTTSRDVARAVLGQLLHQPRTLDDLRAILRREVEIDPEFGLVGEVLGIEAEFQAALAADPDLLRDDWYHQWVARATPDQLGAVITGLALQDELLGSLIPWIDGMQDKAARRVALAARYGVDVLAIAGGGEVAEGTSTPSPAARATEGAGADAAPAARAVVQPVAAWPLPKPKDKVQKVDAGRAAAVERAEAGA